MQNPQHRPQYIGNIKILKFVQANPDYTYQSPLQLYPGERHSSLAQYRNCRQTFTSSLLWGKIFIQQGLETNQAHTIYRFPGLHMESQAIIE